MPTPPKLPYEMSDTIEVNADIKGQIKIVSNPTTVIEDNLTWKTMDQLHNATSNFSKQSFEIKKICLTLEVAALTLIGNFVNSKLDLALFVTGLIIAVLFYLLDVMTYYYQTQLRGKMLRVENEYRLRHQMTEKVNDFFNKPILRSFFNWSHWIYGAIIVLDIVLYFVFKDKLT
jgi:hypothetical protein